MEDGLQTANIANDQIEWQKRSFKRHRKKEGQIIFLTYWTCAISKTQSWNRNSRSIQAEFLHRDDIVNDDSGSYAVFTEQGSSALQMTKIEKQPAQYQHTPM